MTHDYQAASRVFHAALELPIDERHTFVERECAEDAGLRDEVLGLVAAALRADPYFDDLGCRLAGEATDDHLGATLHFGQRVGAWRILRLIGIGGMGEVYLAERADGLYEQQVALKVAQAAHGQTQQFLRERERLARLHHPAISRIIDAGQTEDDRPFMVMDFVKGTAIDLYCQGRPLRECVALGAALCDAVEHAHSRLILHRDIKPSNVLIDHDGQPKLIDFGVATLLDEAKSQELLPLTPRYAAPEQIRGGDVSVRTDVFALGMLLHQIVTGTLPDRDLRSGAVVWISEVGDRDLAAVLRRATDADPEHRHRSAAELADDLRAVLDRRPVSAREPTWSYHLGLTARRHPVATLSSVMTAIALLVALGVSIVLAHTARRAQQDAELALADAEYYLDRSEAAESIQAAIADNLHRIFGSIDEAQVSKIMSERAEIAFAARKSDPKRAAEIALAAGHSFVQRNDYVSALRVLEPWINEGYGDPFTLKRGRLFLAFGYAFTGQEDRAVPILRDLEADHALSRDAGDYEHLVALVHLARLTRDPADQERALRFLELGLKKVNEPEELLFVWAYLETFYRRAGRFDASFDAAKKAMAIVEKNPLADLHGQLSVRNMLVSYWIYYAGDFDLARKQLERVKTIARETNEQPSLAEAIYLEGEIALFEDRFDEAVGAFKRSQDIERRYGNEDVGGTASMVEALAELKRYEDAAKILSAWDEKHEWRHPRVVLADAFLRIRRDGSASATRLLALEGFDQSMAQSSIVGAYRAERLERLGAVINH
ncbi:MAG: protein kinase [Myxococcota bacterium]